MDDILRWAKEIGTFHCGVTAWETSWQCSGLIPLASAIKMFALHLCNPILLCLSDRGIRLKDESTGLCVCTIPTWSSTSLREVIDRFELALSCPDRVRSQPVYDRNLEDYYRRYRDGIPEVSTMFLDRTHMTFLFCTVAEA